MLEKRHRATIMAITNCRLLVILASLRRFLAAQVVNAKILGLKLICSN